MRSPPTSAVADGPVNEAPYRLIRDAEFGENVTVYSFTNLYGCRIGDNTRIGPFVEIQSGAVVGARCKVQILSAGEWRLDPTVIEQRASIGSGAIVMGGLRTAATLSLERVRL
jgi:UDP-2-acetamido-3-amino-2,3-dideoxy-glucuronate N-acetyltransferase